MSLVICSDCGHQVSTNADSCPGCGAIQKKNGISKWWLLTVPALVGAIVFIAAQPMSQEDLQQLQLKDQVAACWVDQKRESHTPGAKRFIAGACEMLENEYFKKYGRKP